MGEDKRREEFISQISSQNPPVSKELIEVLIRNTQQSTEQSTMVRSSLIDMGNKLNDISTNLNSLSLEYKSLFNSIEQCPIKKDELALQRLRVDIENLKLTLSDVKRSNNDFISLVDENVIQPYSKAGGVDGFFSKFMRKYFGYILTAIIILNMIEVIIIYYHIGG